VLVAERGEMLAAPSPVAQTTILDHSDNAKFANDLCVGANREPVGMLADLLECFIAF
jgi:hypothetical protein